MADEQNAINQLNSYNEVSYESRGMGIGGFLLHLSLEDPSGLQVVVGIDAEVAGITDSQIDNLRNMRFIESLILARNSLTDRSVKSIVESRFADRLNYLELGNTDITNESLSDLSRLGSLQFLGLNSTGVSDEGIVKLRVLTNLKTLTLCDTDITDLGLEYLGQYLKLKEVDITSTQCTAAGIERFISLQAPNANKVLIGVTNLGLTEEWKESVRKSYPWVRFLD
ncbi:Leucine Rich repeats (2 copies) [Aeoliella mucimassa]|uniref:Leucine Rich repeats (2 copies) n=2 Tax=Aeoliella mucimassa TaxID=2527972 RepID=A0A518ALQ2_9BACT|nr:Leucine Rich repeats (2 copies) [Aeoliella mucimassa]